MDTNYIDINNINNSMKINKNPFIYILDPLNNENKLKYKVNVPDNVTHFVLYIYLEGYFPIPPQYIKMDVTRV